MARLSRRMQQLRDILEVPFQHGYTHILDDFTPTVLLTDKVGIDYYDEEEFPIRYNLELLTGVASPITFIRTTEEAGKSPMGTTLSDMCQFDDGVYKVNLDRAIELHLDERKLSLEKGTYTICVDEAANTDFLWYLAVIDNELSDIFGIIYSASHGIKFQSFGVIPSDCSSINGVLNWLDIPFFSSS